MNQLLEFSSDLIELLIVDCMQKFYLILIVVFLKFKNQKYCSWHVFLSKDNAKLIDDFINN